jgi:hypothetical protein
MLYQSAAVRVAFNAEASEQGDPVNGLLAEGVFAAEAY